MLPLNELQALFVHKKIEVRPIAIHTSTKQELVAPVTLDGEKLLFELSDANMHDISEDHDINIRAPHDTSKSQCIPLHIIVNEELAKVLDFVDERVKKGYRVINDDCPSWLSLVKTSFTGNKVLMVDVVLDNSDASTQMLIMKNDQLLEGSGKDFLDENIGGVQNLKDYTCNPVLELAWIMHRDCDGAHRLRVKTHSIMLKKKVKEPAMKRMKMSGAKMNQLLASHRLTRVANTF